MNPSGNTISPPISPYRSLPASCRWRRLPNTSSNWHYSDFDKTYFEDKNDLATYLHWDWSIVNYVKKTISKYSLDKYSDQFTLYGGVFYNKTNPATGLPYYVEETEEVEAA